MDLYDNKLHEFSKKIEGTFKRDFSNFRQLSSSMESRVKEMEALYSQKMGIAEFESKVNEIAFKNEEIFRE